MAIQDIDIRATDDGGFVIVAIDGDGNEQRADLDVGTLLASQVGSESDPSDSVYTDDAQVGSATVDNTRAAVRNLDRYYRCACVADDGTFYALWHDAAAGTPRELRLYRGTDPEDLEQVWSKNVDSGKNKWAIHITQNGTLITAWDGSIRRSTDDGDSFTAVQSLPTNSSRLWSISEASNGNLIATHDQGVDLYQSTDDGASWTKIADGSTFSQFNDHLHKARYHPNNDEIIVTGGDSGGTGWYRSTDDGSTWDHLQINPGNERNWVGIAPDPTSGQYLLGDDQTGEGHIVKITDPAGTGELGDNQREIVLETNVRNAGGIMGSFAMWAVDDSKARSYFGFAATETWDFWASNSLHGQNWKIVGQGSGVETHPYSATTSQGPHESVFDPATTPLAIVGDRALHLRQVGDYQYGAGHRQPVDARSAKRPISFHRREHGHVWDPSNPSGNWILDDIRGDNHNWERLQRRINNGRIELVHFGGTYPIPRRYDPSKEVNRHQAPTHQYAEDLTASGAPAPTDNGVFATHDGTGTPPAGLYESDPANSQWVGIGTASGNTIAY